jgi:ComF family protein
MADFLNNCVKQDGFDIIVPVPLYPSRFRQRGFNQAELLAKNVALFSGRPLAANAIKRIRPTLAQAGLSKTERFKNTRGAFKVTDAAGVCGKDVLIIDDVLTTGSTISECARALRKAGAKSISALVLAKGM